jgi:hypothetical protein
MSEGFGSNGGYVISGSDRFFDTPVENLCFYAGARRSMKFSREGPRKHDLR